MKTHSIWNDKTSEALHSVEKDFYTDVLIIGGGMTGLSALYHLVGKSMKVTLVEQNTCGRGVTSKSTAKITYLQDNTIIKVANYLGEEKAKLYIQSQIEGMNILKNIITKEHISCDFQEVTSFLFTDSKNNSKKLTDLYALLEQCNAPVTRVSEVPFAEGSKDAIAVSGTYVFHPLKYIDALKKKSAKHIYENSKVDDIVRKGEYYVSSVGTHRITSKYVVIASHYPYFLIPYLFPLKSHVEVSYLGAKRTKEFQNYSAINLDKPTISERFHRDKENFQIQLRGSYISSNVQNIKTNFEEITKRGDFDYLWSNNDIITSDGLPYVGPLYKDDASLILATGYNTWGMTNGTLAGKIVADAICKRSNPYAVLFDPRRSLNLAKVLELSLNTVCSAVAYIKSGKTNSNNSRVRYAKIDGVNVAIYEDANGKEHTVINRCPHMKCGLVFNEVEKTWDCLCHGSRYDLDGHVIEGPSFDDIIFERKN